MCSIWSERYQYLLVRLKEARYQAGLTQAEAAALLGKTQSYISKVESGERRVGFIELEDLAAAYGRPLEYFATLPHKRRNHEP